MGAHDKIKFYAGLDVDDYFDFERLINDESVPEQFRVIAVYEHFHDYVMFNAVVKEAERLASQVRTECLTAPVALAIYLKVSRINLPENVLNIIFGRRPELVLPVMRLLGGTDDPMQVRTRHLSSVMGMAVAEKVSVAKCANRKLEAISRNLNCVYMEMVVGLSAFVWELLALDGYYTGKADKKIVQPFMHMLITAHETVRMLPPHVLADFVRLQPELAEMSHCM